MSRNCNDVSSRYVAIYAFLLLLLLPGPNLHPRFYIALALTNSRLFICSSGQAAPGYYYTDISRDNCRDGQFESSAKPDR